jgi:hypothetical protein
MLGIPAFFYLCLILKLKAMAKSTSLPTIRVNKFLRATSLSIPIIAQGFGINEEDISHNMKLRLCDGSSEYKGMTLEELRDTRNEIDDLIEKHEVMLSINREIDTLNAMGYHYVLAEAPEKPSIFEGL